MGDDHSSSAMASTTKPNHQPDPPQRLAKPCLIDLPPEILDQIASYCRINDKALFRAVRRQRLWDEEPEEYQPPTLHSLCLTCHQLYGAAMPHLYRKFACKHSSMNVKADYVRILHFIFALVANPELAGHVRKLSFMEASGIDSVCISESSELDGCREGLLEKFGQARTSISATSSTMPAHMRDFLDQLTNQVWPGRHALSIDKHPFVDQEILLLQVCRATKLQFELRERAYESWMSPPMDIMPWGPSAQFFSASAANLQCISLRLQRQDWSHEFLQLILHCPNLRQCRVVISGDCNPEALEETPVYPMPNVVNLSINSPCRHAIRMLSSDCPKLEQLSVFLPHPMSVKFDMRGRQRLGSDCGPQSWEAILMGIQQNVSLRDSLKEMTLDVGIVQGHGVEATVWPGVVDTLRHFVNLTRLSIHQSVVVQVQPNTPGASTRKVLHEILPPNLEWLGITTFDSTLVPQMYEFLEHLPEEFPLLETIEYELGEFNFYQRNFLNLRHLDRVIMELSVDFALCGIPFVQAEWQVGRRPF